MDASKHFGTSCPCKTIKHVEMTKHRKLSAYSQNYRTSLLVVNARKGALKADQKKKEMKRKTTQYLTNLWILKSMIKVEIRTLSIHGL